MTGSHVANGVGLHHPVYYTSEASHFKSTFTLTVYARIFEVLMLVSDINIITLKMQWISENAWVNSKWQLGSKLQFASQAKCDVLKFMETLYIQKVNKTILKTWLDVCVTVNYHFLNKVRKSLRFYCCILRFLLRYLRFAKNCCNAKLIALY